ncbi:MAG: aldehyde-activating protein [Deltaproteobacteria bacterium]|nr:aldehyde-activating protein [Deltaproteobacteria bacterium]
MSTPSTGSHTGSSAGIQAASQPRSGACHCGALVIELVTARAPAALPVRTCGCTFCRKHRPRYTSDPAGHVTIRCAVEATLARYRFGLRLADFLICRTCGVFVAAYEPGEPGRAVINLEVLACAAELVAAPVAFTGYDGEDVAARTARRAANWTPATLVIGDRSEPRAI